MYCETEHRSNSVRKFHFPSSADHDQDLQPYPVDAQSVKNDDHTSCMFFIGVSVLYKNTNVLYLYVSRWWGFHTFVQAMSDSLDHVVEERFPLALSFFQALVRISEGRLGPLALQRTFLGLSFLCSYACSSRGWVHAGGGKRGPLKDSDPSLCTLKELLRLVCRQVQIRKDHCYSFLAKFFMCM